MFQHHRIFAFLMRIRDLLWKRGVSHPLFGCFLLCCVLVAMLVMLHSAAHSVYLADRPTLPWPNP